MGGYDGNVLFENLELVRVPCKRPADGKCRVPICSCGGYRRRRATLLAPRIRQAYDEFARPVRLASALSVLPFLLALVWRGQYLLGLALILLLPICLGVGAAAVGAGRCSASPPVCAHRFGSWRERCAPGLR